MGSVQSFSVLWKQIKDTKRNTRQRVSKPDLQLINSDTQAAYLLTYRCNKLSFTAEHEELQYYLNILICSSFEQTKYNSQVCRMLADLSHTAIQPIKDYFNFKEENTRNLNVAIVTENCDFATLSEWLAMSQTLGVYLSGSRWIEAALRGFFEVLEALCQLHISGSFLGMLTPENLILKFVDSNVPQAAARTSVLSASVKIMLLSTKQDDELTPPEHDWQSPAADVWCAGYLMYCVITGKSIETSALDRLSQADRFEELDLQVKDKAVCEILKMCLSDITDRALAEQILCHKYVRYWRMGMQEHEITLDLLPAIYTSLSFDESDCLQDIFLLSASYATDVFSYLHSKNFNWITLVKAMKMLDRASILVQEGCVSILTTVVRNHKGLRRKMLDQGVLETVLKIKPNIPPGLFLSFCSEFSTMNSATVFVFCNEMNIIQEAVDTYAESAASRTFLRQALPNFGDMSLGIARQLYENKHWDLLETLEFIGKFPPIHLQQSLAAVYELFSIMISDCYSGRTINSRDQFCREVKGILNILISVERFYPALAETCRRGDCTSSDADISEYGRTPLLLMCKACIVPVCLSCASNCHHRCIKKALYLQSDMSKCQCNAEHIQSIDSFPKFKFLPTKPKHLISSPELSVTSADSQNFRITMNQWKGKEASVKTEEPLYSLEALAEIHKLSQGSTVESTCCYFEVRVVNGGYRDAISIGLQGLEYRSWSGEIVSGGLTICVASPYGAHDIVGVGLTNYGRVYFTYNGLMIRPMFGNVNFVPEVKLTFFSLEACVELIFDSKKFVFHPKTTPEGMMTEEFKGKLDKLLKAYTKRAASLKELEDLFANLNKYFHDELAKPLATYSKSSSVVETQCHTPCCITF